MTVSRPDIHVVVVVVLCHPQLFGYPTRSSVQARDEARVHPDESCPFDILLSSVFTSPCVQGVLLGFAEGTVNMARVEAAGSDSHWSLLVEEMSALLEVLQVTTMLPDALGRCRMEQMKTG